MRLLPRIRDAGTRPGVSKVSSLRGACRNRCSNPGPGTADLLSSMRRQWAPGATVNYPACDVCGGVGCIARAGVLTVVPAAQLRLGRGRSAAVRVEALLLSLPSLVPDVAEREFLDETLKCYRAGAFRAAIVMSWNLAYDHLLNYIFRHGLVAFNAQWPKSFTKQHDSAPVSEIASRDHFSLLRESEVLQICKSAAIISQDIYRVLDEKLKNAIRPRTLPTSASGRQRRKPLSTRL